MPTIREECERLEAKLDAGEALTTQEATFWNQYKGLYEFNKIQRAAREEAEATAEAEAAKTEAEEDDTGDL